MKDRWIANVGLCAAAGIFVASLSILFLQGNLNSQHELPSFSPAQIRPDDSMGAPSGHQSMHSQNQTHAGDDLQTASL
jgi:hypothetical protein